MTQKQNRFAIKLSSGAWLFENRAVQQNTPAGKSTVGRTTVGTWRLQNALTYSSREEATKQLPEIMLTERPAEIIEI